MSKAGRKKSIFTTPTLPNRFAELLAIKERVSGRQWTQEDIRQEIKARFDEEVSSDTLSRYYNNRVERYDARIVRALSDWLGVSVRDFWVDTTPPNPSSPKTVKANARRFAVAGSGDG